MLPGFPENQHMKVAKLSDLGTSRLYPQETFQATISVTDSAGRRAKVDRKIAFVIYE
jgi:hypothetical protein